MRVYEILNPARTLSATARFRETFKHYRQSYAGLDQTLRAFVEFRLVHRPDEPFGPKDTPFTGPGLKGFRHFHMVRGRVILIYQVTHAELRLCLVMDHAYSTTHGKSSLGAYLRSPSTDYQSMAIRPTRQLSKSQITAINDFFYKFAADDRDEFAKLIADPNEMMEYIRMVLQVPWTDEEKDAATMQAFDGPDGLRKAATAVLRRVGGGRTALT